jgi:hypothetical protein
MAVRTSASFYRRGVPDYFKTFAIYANANYTVFQPNYLAVLNAQQVIKANFRKNVLYI